MKKRRSEKNKANLKNKLNTPSEELHEAVEIIEELSDESENPNDDEQTELESEDNYGIEFDEEGMCADPTPEFWEAWQEDKEKIKERGWWVVKEKNPASPLWGKWLIFETQKHLKSYTNLSSIKDFRGSWEPETRPYFRQSLAASVSVSFPNTYKQSTLRRY